jgi:hypothetical protein
MLFLCCQIRMGRANFHGLLTLFLDFTYLLLNTERKTRFIFVQVRTSDEVIWTKIELSQTFIVGPPYYISSIFVRRV